MTFATAINCLDGRVQEPVIRFLKETYELDYVDMVTEPGPNRILSEEKESFRIESIRKRVQLSVERHGSELVAISGHYDCAGNPSDESAQKRQIRSAMRMLESWNFNVSIVGLWVNSHWAVVPIDAPENAPSIGR